MAELSLGRLIERTVVLERSAVVQEAIALVVVLRLVAVCCSECKLGPTLTAHRHFLGD